MDNSCGQTIPLHCKWKRMGGHINKHYISNLLQLYKHTLFYESIFFMSQECQKKVSMTVQCTYM